MALSATGIGQDQYPTTVEDFRNLIAAALPGSGAAGIGQFPVAPVAAEGGLAVEVGPGRVVLEGRAASGQGSYVVWSATPEVLAWPTPSAQPRVDALVLAVADAQYGAVELQGPSWLIVQGTASTTPAAPTTEEISAAAPAGAWTSVATVRVDPGDTVIAPANIARTLLPRDGGWRPIGLPSGIVPHLGRTPLYRVRDGRVWLNGAIARSNNSDFTDAHTTGDAVLLYVPPEVAPSRITYGYVQSIARRSIENFVGGGLMRAEVRANGEMYCHRDNFGYTTPWIGIDGFYWWLD